MAVINTTWYPSSDLKTRLLTGTLKHDFSADTFKIILLGTNSAHTDPKTITNILHNYNSYTVHGAGSKYLQEFELTSTGTSYTAGGNALVNKTIRNITTSDIPTWKFDADDAVWNNLDVSNTDGVYGFAIYNSSLVGYGPSVGIGLFDQAQTFTTSNFKVQFSTDGIFHI